jgi:succinate-semialdehyde dehydrogenase / glutarate-semialdehyde dehydrogenase
MYQTFGLFIGGSWSSASGGSAQVISPVTERPIGEAPVATRADTEAAIAAAERGLAAWSGRTTPLRQ